MAFLLVYCRLFGFLFVWEHVQYVMHLHQTVHICNLHLVMVSMFLYYHCNHFEWLIFVLKIKYLKVSLLKFTCPKLIEIEFKKKIKIKMTSFLPSLLSLRCPLICSFTNLFVFGTLSACLIPTAVWSKWPGPLFGTCEQQ